MRDRSDVALSTQTFSFFQELTEAVASLPYGMMVVTLPSSYLEDFGEHQEASLARLNKIFGRIESIETPVQGEEVYAVIRRRLFEVERLQIGAMREIVHGYFQAYQEHRDELPAKARDVNYRSKMELAYPFHPDVIDILYEKWSTFSSFQRTRGVLRLLANVVEDLYHREVNLDLILPGDLNLGHPQVRQEFLRHTGPEFEGVIGSDIAGHEAKAPALDADNRAWKHLAQRTATAVFFHSFTAEEAARGATLPYFKLAVMRSDTIPAMVTEVLQRLTNTLWYLNSEGERSYFSRIPNLNRMILDKKELHNRTYQARMRAIIERELGSKMQTYLWPEANGGRNGVSGIPDNRAIKLVVLHPEQDEGRIATWLERKGTTFREYKNTLIFALADMGAFAKLKEDVKTVLALEEIEDEIKRGVSPLPEERRSEVQRRTQAITRDVSYNVRRMYPRLRTAAPDGGLREHDLGTPVAGRETLTGWYWRELTSMDYGVIVEQLHYRMLANRILATADQVPTSVVLDQFYKNPALPLPASEGVVARAIQLGVQEGALGLVELRDGEPDPRSLKFGETIPLDAVDFALDQVLLSRERGAALEARIAAEEEEEGQPAAAGTGAMPGAETTIRGAERVPGRGAVVSGDEAGEGEPPSEAAYHRLRLVIADIPASKIADVNRGVFLPLSNLADGGLTFTLELDITSEDGIPQKTLEQTLKETLRQIGARVVEEEKA